MQRVSGSVARVERKRGPVWYARYRLPVRARSARGSSGRPGRAAGGRRRGYFTKRTAEDWLRDQLDEVAARTRARRRSVATGVTFAEAAEEYLRFAEQDRGCKPSTIRGYRSRSTPICCRCSARCAIEDITEHEIERWRAGMIGRPRRQRVLSNKTKNHQLVLLHAIFRRAVKLYGLPAQPGRERRPLPRALAAATSRCSRPRRSGPRPSRRLGGRRHRSS